MIRTLCLLLLLAAPARAAFDPTAYSPRAAVFGAAMASIADDPVSQLYNPATLGVLDDAAASMDYMRQFHSPAGSVNDDLFNVVGAAPVKQEIINGTFGFGFSYDRKNDVRANERAYQMGYGTRDLWSQDDKRLETGGSLKILDEQVDGGGKATLKAALDAGVLYRWAERYALGFSLINLNRPSFQVNGKRDRAPAEVQLAVSENARGFILGLGLAKREPSGGHPGSAELAGGFERWWATSRMGSFAARSGLSLGERDKSWTWGLGWRVLGADLNYSMSLPLSGPSAVSHAVGLAFRFGQSNPEAEYEKVLASEVRYRKDLVKALEAGEVKQLKLAEELQRERDEIDSLKQKLAAKSATAEQTGARLKELEDRHRRAVETFERLKRESQQVKVKTKQELFEEDWGAYQRLKLSGAPDSVLIDHVKTLLSQYKDSGVDLSTANQELVRLLRAK